MKKETQKQMMMFLLLAGICFHLLPELLLTIVFYVKASSLDKWIITLCKASSILIGLILILVSMFVAFVETKEHCKKQLLHAIKGMVIAIFSVLLYDFVMGLIENPLLLLASRHYVIAMILLAIISIIFIAIQGSAVYWWVVSTLLPYEISLKQLLKKPFSLLLVSIVTIFVNAIPNIITAFLSILPDFIKPTISFNFMVGLCIAILQAVGLGVIFIICKKAYTKQLEQSILVEQEASVPKLKLKKRVLPHSIFAISSIGIVVILFIQGLTSLLKNPVDEICGNISEKAALSSMSLLQGDFDGGYNYLKEAVALYDAWGNIVGMEECTDIYNVYYQNPSSNEICYLYFLEKNQMGELESYIRQNGFNPEFCLALLDLYAKQNHLTDVQKVLANEMKMVCAVTGTYISDVIRPDDIIDYSEKLEKELRNYSELKNQLELLGPVTEIMRTGVATIETVNACLNYAEKHLDNWTAQYQAAVAGSSLTYDDAFHYNRTIQAAIRFEKLYCSNDKLENEEILYVQKKTAQMIMNCYGYEQALPYLEKAIELGGVEPIFSVVAKCYEKLEQHEKCYNLCLKMLEIDPNRLEARYYAALNALKLGNRDDALEHTSKLAELAQNATKENIGADVSLYTMLQFIAVTDSDRWTEYQYAFYTQMTEEQKTLVSENTFFANYLEAVYQCFSNKSSGHLDLALEAINKVLEENENLPQAWYLKGAIHYARKEFKEAIDAYKKSIAIVPDSATTWFALANAYDAMEQYELAYKACEQTMILLPVEDHQYDWYGVSIHCQNLMNALKQKLTGGQ